jgi:ComF family protein
VHFNSFLMPFGDFFFPPLCFSCNVKLQENETRLCSSCWNSIEPVGDADRTVDVLRSRFQEGGVIDDFESCYYFEHNGVLQKIAHSLKYEAVTVFGQELGRHLGEKIAACGKFTGIDAIIPVPLHRLKRRERGYNQSEFISYGIAEKLNQPVLTSLIQRKKKTISQTHLTAEERAKNVEDAFEIPRKVMPTVKGKVFLLVDDVITTGATIQSMAWVLKNAGAKKIYVGSAALAKLE